MDREEIVRESAEVINLRLKKRGKWGIPISGLEEEESLGREGKSWIIC